MCVRVCVHLVKGVGEVQKRTLDPLEWVYRQLSHLVWLPGAKLGCSGRAASHLNYQAISPALPYSHETRFFTESGARLLTSKPLWSILSLPLTGPE